MTFRIGWIGKMVLFLLGVRGIPKDSLMLECKKCMHVDDYDDDHKDEIEDEDDQTSLNGKGRFVPRGKMCGRGF